MKKYSLTAVFILFSVLTTSAQWQWAKQLGGVENDAPNIKVTDSNLYVGGNFIFNCHLDTNILVSNGYNDLFIAKYDLTGTNRIWLKQIGNNNSPTKLEFGSVSYISDSALYFIGQFYNTLWIDGLSITSAGGADAFLAKLDLNGNCIWLKSAGGLSDDYAGAVAIDSYGTIYWSERIYSNSGNIDGVGLLRGNSLIKLDGNGNVLSVKNNFVQGGYTLEIKIIDDLLFFTGETENDTAIVLTDTLISNNVTDGLLAKTDLMGNLIWAKRFGGSTHNDAALGFEVDSNRNLYLTGQYSDTLQIDGNILFNQQPDMFVAKFDSSGTNLWVRGSHSDGVTGAYASEIAKDTEGKFYIIGGFSGSAQFGGFNLSTTNDQDMFLARYDENGNCIGVKNFGSAQGFLVRITSSNEIFVCGIFENTVTIGGATFTSYGMQDGFVAKADAITAIDEGKRLSNLELLIYSNPNQGTFNIKVPESVTTFKNALLLIFDATEKEVARFSLDESNENPHFDISKSAKGLYTVKLIQGDKSYSGKLIVQ